MPETSDSTPDVNQAEQAVEALPVDLPDIDGAGPDIAARKFDHLLDVIVDVSAVIGKRQLMLEEVAGIQSGTVIDLEKAAGDPIELTVNGKAVALAEVVVVDGHLGARILKVLGTDELVQQPSESSETEPASES